MKVSIITVCYNSAKTIEQTILSVVNQTYSNIEYIIIDGGSTDGTLDIIKKYEKNISYWLSEADDGLYYAMNKGIQKSTGDIVGIINSDDWYAQDAVNKVVEFFKKNSTDLLHGDLNVIEEDGNEYIIKGVTAENDKIASWYDHPTVFIKRAVYMKYGLFNLKYKILADVEFMLRVKNKVRIGYLPEAIVYFRMGGISNLTFWRIFREGQDVLKNAKQNLPIDKNGAFEIEKRIVDWRISNLNKYLKKRRLRLKDKSYLFQLLKQYNKKNYIIWGTGKIGRDFYKEFNKFDKNLIISFIDNNKKQHDKYFDDEFKIVGSDSIQDKDSLIVVASNKYGKEISRDLIKKGLVKKVDFLLYEDVLKELNKFYVEEYLTIIQGAKKHDWNVLQREML